MLKKLRLRLAILCTLCTFLVVAAMAGVSFAFSLRQMESQAEASFHSNVNAVLFYLQTAETIDHTWLRQTEEDNSLYIRVCHGGKTLEYSELVPLHAEVTGEALGFAQRAYPRQWTDGAAYLEDANEFFAISTGGQTYRGASCVLPKGGEIYNIIIVKNQAALQSTKIELLLFYVAGTFAAALALGGFAWLFCGRAVRPAQQAEQTQKDFLRAASHELRSPLSVIRLSAGSIKTLPNQAEALADKIELECERMGRLVSDLLLLTGGKAGVGLVKEEVSPRTVLLASYERFEDLAAEKGLGLTPRLPDAPVGHASWDTARIEQALAVLLDNAISYTPAGGKILLKLVLQGNEVVYTVEDSGPGIPVEERERVFDRFYRADAARSKKEHYGLGLSVAREIVRLHGGRLLAGESESLGGAAMYMYLPRESG